MDQQIEYHNKKDVYWLRENSEISSSHGGEWEDGFLDVAPCSLVRTVRRFRDNEGLEMFKVLLILVGGGTHQATGTLRKVFCLAGCLGVEYINVRIALPEGFCDWGGGITLAQGLHDLGIRAVLVLNCTLAFAMQWRKRSQNLNQWSRIVLCTNRCLLRSLWAASLPTLLACADQVSRVTRVTPRYPKQCFGSLYLLSEELDFSGILDVSCSISKEDHGVLWDPDSNTPGPYPVLKSAEVSIQITAEKRRLAERGYKCRVIHMQCYLDTAGRLRHVVYTQTEDNGEDKITLGYNRPHAAMCRYGWLEERLKRPRRRHIVFTILR